MKADIILQNNTFEFSTVTKQGNFVKKKKSQTWMLSVTLYSQHSLTHKHVKRSQVKIQNISVWIKDTQTNDFF